MGDSGIQKVSFAPANAALEKDILALVDLDDLFAGKWTNLSLKITPSLTVVSFPALKHI